MSPVAQDAADMIASIQRAWAAADLASDGGYYTGLKLPPPGEVDRILNGMGPDLQLSHAQQTSFKAARELIEGNSQPLAMDVAGLADFERAFTLFHEAYAASPRFRGTFRAVAMLYADRALWGNLETFARAHITSFPRDSLAWLALGLALHRQEKDASARVAFDSALATLGPAERDRLDNWRRVLSPGIAHARSEGSAAERSAVERLYWLASDPVWADAALDTRSEFLARVAYAELRWSVEEFDLSGADSDRGETYVRYGPPDVIAMLGSTAAEPADVTTFWMYDSGLMFAFNGMPTFGTARIAHGDQQMVDGLRRALPVRWDNVRAPRMDTVATRIARFRGTRDSADVVIAARLPSPDTIRASMSVSGPVQRHLWILNGDLQRVRAASHALDSAGAHAWTERVRAGAYVFRVEAFGSTARRGSVAIGALDATIQSFPSNGFGISDVLVAGRIRLPERARLRWTDLEPATSVGAVQRGSRISLVWENYEFGDENGEARYNVTLTLRRERSAAGRIAAEVVGALAAVARVSGGDDEVVVTFERSAPHAAAFADQITLDLGSTPSGTYALTLEVSDRVRGRVATRSSSLVIRN
jgi:GWxTD domain-containing protein